MERTFVAIKPDGVEKGLIGEIITRFERKGYKLLGLKFLNVKTELAHKHYMEHIGKPFFDDLVEFIISGPVVAMAWEGNQVVSGARKLIGATNPADAAPGTIRADYAINVGRNIIHGADSIASAEREIGLFFEARELTRDNE
jgi:nucleoside-diphosphate kinase